MDADGWGGGGNMIEGDKLWGEIDTEWLLRRQQEAARLTREFNQYCRCIPKEDARETREPQITQISQIEEKSKFQILKSLKGGGWDG